MICSRYKTAIYCNPFFRLCKIVIKLYRITIKKELNRIVGLSVIKPMVRGPCPGINRTFTTDRCLNAYFISLLEARSTRLESVLSILRPSARGILAPLCKARLTYLTAIGLQDAICFAIVSVAERSLSPGVT